MRIALDVSKASSRDGLGSYTRGLIHALADLTREGWPTTGHPSEGPTLRFLLLNLLGAAEPEDLTASLGELPELFELDLTRWQEKSPGEQATVLANADVLLATSWSLPATAPPSLFVVYDLTFLTHPQCHTLDNRLHCAEGLLRARISGSAFTAISDASAAELNQHLGIASEEILVAPPSAGSAFKPPTSGALERVVERHRLGEVAGFILSVGSLEPRKNLNRLLDAHARLDGEQRRAFPLCLVGGGGWRQEVLESRIANTAPGTLHRLGGVSEKDLVDLFGAATLFVYPSLAEGFGLPVLEAMACATPVITSNISSLPEVAGNAARLVDPLDVQTLTDTLDELLRDVGARAEMSKRGLERAQIFSWQRSARLLIDRLHELAG